MHKRRQLQKYRDFNVGNKRLESEKGDTESERGRERQRERGGKRARERKRDIEGERKKERETERGSGIGILLWKEVWSRGIIKVRKI